MVYCPECKIANREGSRFCNDCGAKLPVASATPTTRAAQKISEPPPPPEEAAPHPLSPSLEDKGTFVADDTPDWLRSLRAGATAAEPTAAPVVVEPTTDDMPDWLKQMQTDTGSTSATPIMAEPEAAPAGELPDWLAQARQTRADTPPFAPPMPVPIAEPALTDMPNWLQQMRDDATPAATPTPAMPMPTTEPASADMPAWLSQMRDDATPAASMPTTEPASADMPAWLSQMRDDATPVAPPTPVTPMPTPTTEPSSGDMPAWLQQLRPDTAGTTPVEPEAPSEAREASGLAPAALPDWLAQAQVQSEIETHTAAPTADASGGMPSWLADLQQTTSEPTASGGLAAGETPDWLKDIASAQGATTGGEAGLASGDVPDWLKGLAPASALPTPELEPAGLATGDVPSWLKAMKPAGKIETPSGATIETTGLLAGVRDALPVEKAFLVSHKPKATDASATKARTSTAGFAELATPEAVPPAATAVEEKPKPKGWRRWFPFLHIFAIFAVIVFALLLPPEVRGSTIPNQHPPSAEFYQTINDLKSNALTLIAIDYGAAARAELDPQVRATFLQLLQNKQRFVTLSFVPEGQQIGQSLYDNLPIEYRKAFPYGDYFLNLGYKGGGEAALRALMKPQSVFFKRDAIKGKTLGTDWENFRNVKELNDFALLIVFSDNSDQVQRWVEQVAYPSQKTLLVGATAEATPRIMPYTTTNVKAVLSGLRDAAEYELQLNNPIAVNPSTAAGSFDAISYVSLLLIGVMLVSQVASFIGKR